MKRIPKGDLDLSPQRRELLKILLKEEGVESSSPAPKIPRRKEERTTAAPLSFGQQRLWFLNQLEPNSPFYNIPQVVRLTGPLKVEALSEALTEVVRRHESLRTIFAYDQEPVQVIVPATAVELGVRDLSHLDESERETEAQRLAREEAERPFDLRRGPLLRAGLLRLGQEDHILQLSMHHIISDWWSLVVFFRELAALYKANCEGGRSPLPELAIQYADYAVWQRDHLAGEALESQLSYWREQLRGAPEVLELPTDRPRPAVQTFGGRRQSIMLSKRLSDGLRELGRGEGATLFMTLLAAYQALLARYSHQEEIVVGSPIGTRPHAETEALIGFFVNTLALRTDLSGDPSFRELVRRVKEVALKAYAHQDVPFERVVDELQPERSLSHSSLFQVMFTLENAPGADLKLDGLELRWLEVESTTAKFDLTLFVSEEAEGLRSALEYNTDLFEEATIERMLGHFRTLLEGILAHPDERLSRLPLLTEKERQQLLLEWNNTGVEWNNTGIKYPTDQTLPELFEAQVKRTPEAVAVVGEDERLSYRELNARANQLAHHLQRLGVGPDTLVGIMMERSVEMVVGILGVLKAGGAYLPLDPAYPRERLRFMLEDSRVPVLLTQERLEQQGLVPAPEARIIRLDTDWELIQAGSAENPVHRAEAENLAYVIYTSGSTGRPKGVMNSHGAILNRLLWMQDAYQLSESDRVLQKTPFSFDVSVWEFFWPLVTGARLVVARPGGHQDRAYLVKLIEEEQITTLHFVPSMLQVFLEEEHLEGCRSLRRVICSGEALSFELQERFFARLGAELHNLYGPTEAAVDVTFWACERGGRRRVVPIGRPIANTQIYLLDQHLQPVPVGVPGELHIGGVGLARGYLNRAELTAEKFIPDHFGDRPGARLYKTGDLARYRPTGEIEYLGRIDHQVKIRGFRIELGEIEATLASHPAVQETVVIVREDEPGEKRLIAYVVPQEEQQQQPDEGGLLSSFKAKVPEHLIAHGSVKQEQALSVSALRHFLKERLPEYMVPSAFVTLYQLPLMPNGKVDRRALPAPDQAKPGLERAFVPPRDELELQLAKIWEKVLGLRPIGVKDNFFDLGGHSLMAVRLFAQISKTCGKSLPLATLFLAPTIDQLAGILRKEGWRLPWTSLVPIQPGGSKPPFFCVHAGGGNVLFYRDLARHLGPDQPFYGLQLRTVEGKQLPHASFEEMAAHYIEEIRALQPEGPYYLGGASSGGAVAFEMAQQLLAQGQRVALVAMFDTCGPGYPRYLPNVTARRHKFNSLRRRVEIHLSALKMLEAEGKLNYLAARVKKAPPKIRQWCKNKYRKNAPKFYMAFGRPLPKDLMVNHNVILQSYETYQPKVYPGRVALFRAKTQFPGTYPDPTMGWGGLAAGGLEIHEVPGYHGTIIVEPRVRVLAEKLRLCLTKAEATEPSG